LDCCYDAAVAALGSGLRQVSDVVNGYTWELYNLADDYTQNNDLARKMPNKLRDMQERFLMEATKYNVFPLDNSFTARALTPRPSAERDRRSDRLTFSGESSGLPYSDAPDMASPTPSRPR
jgi:hypothetical protein